MDMMQACARCGAGFQCGMVTANAADAAGPCWCMALPHAAPLPALPDGTDTGTAIAGCWCRACLEQHIAHRAAAASGSHGPG
jgi:hypothetical protein